MCGTLIEEKKDVRDGEDAIIEAGPLISLSADIRVFQSGEIGSIPCLEICRGGGR